MPNKAEQEARARLSPEDRREQLIRVASDIIGSDGVDHIRIPYVASSAGVTRPVVYKFFPNRQAIIVAVLESFRSDLERRLPAIQVPAEGDLEDTTREFVDAACDAIEATGPGGWILLGSTGFDSEIAGITEEVQAGLIAPWLDAIEALTGGKPQEVQALAMMIIAAGRAAIHRWMIGDLQREQVKSLLLRTFVAILEEFSA